MQVCCLVTRGEPLPWPCCCIDALMHGTPLPATHGDRHVPLDVRHRCRTQQMVVYDL